jgi:transcriptional regulator with XRE-family HTH domain
MTAIIRPHYASIMWNARPVGELLRDWRQRRRLSQLALAVSANVSTRHLSFVESGRSTPSREMLLHLAEELEVPLRERNRLLLAAGYAPAYPEHALGDPELDSALRAVMLVLEGHEPYPALALDRRWNLIASNRAVGPLIADTSAELLKPPVNVLRLSLHPSGLAPRIENLAQWRAHLLSRLARAVELSADPQLVELMQELRAYPEPIGAHADRSGAGLEREIVVPLKLRGPHGTLAFISTTTVFGSPLEVSLSELAIEAFFPADPGTAAALRSANDTRQ